MSYNYSMFNIIFVVFFVLLSGNVWANTFDDKLLQIESEWAEVHYNYPEDKKPDAFLSLMDKASALAEQHSKRAEPVILLATIILTHAGTEGPFAALSSIHRARDLLFKALAIDPHASQGSAYVTLGTLYYKVPGWPIAFGDDKKAEKLLLNALHISPDAIDTNYFFGDFLLSQGNPVGALKHFKKAINAPVDPEKKLANSMLQAQAKEAFENTRLRNISDARDSFPPSLYDHQAD